VGFTDSNEVGTERRELKLTQRLKNKMPDPLSDFTKPDSQWACGRGVLGTLFL